MIKLLRYLIFGDAHSHKWVLHETIDLVNDSNQSVGVKYVLRCSVCGEMKTFKG